MKRFITICIILLLLSLVTAAGSDWKDISVWYGATVTVNNSPLSPTDANGNAAPPIMINGTVYLPARAIAEAMGGTITWDSENKVAGITYKEPEPSKYAFPFELRSDDGENRFLGKCITHGRNLDSIFYDYGLYGEKGDGMYNIYNGIYGYGEYGAMNLYAKNPPLIIDANGEVFARLTNQIGFDGGMNLFTLKNFLEENGQ